MAIINTTKIDTTIRVFDNFYSTQLVINAAEWDVVYSYFKGTSKNSQIAEQFASLLFRIAQEGNFDVLDLLATIQGANDKLKMNQVICYYLNTFRSRASLYGVGIIPKPNQAVQRNIVL